LEMLSQPGDLGIPQQFRDNGDEAPWDPTNLKKDESAYMMNEFLSTPSSRNSPAGSAHLSPSPVPPNVKLEKTPSPIRKIKGSGKIEKRKSEPANKFVIMTPTIINAASGKPNPFECFEAMRTTQRGRKGPLANEIKENALQVRRLGACFCCHARKVKVRKGVDFMISLKCLLTPSKQCDKERPCRNCTKLTAAVPQIICWQFQDFLPVLFPDFIRGHFKKDQMAAFLSENIEAFRVEGAEKRCEVELFSGTRFQSTLTLSAKFFTAKAPDVLQHWHMNVSQNQLELQSRGAAPIGIDMNSTSYKDELKKKTREYIQNITLEPLFAEQVTDAFRHTELPQKLLKIVQKFSQRSDVSEPSPRVNLCCFLLTLPSHQ
jgi:hypothetical protein